MERILEIIHPQYPVAPRAVDQRRAVRGIALRDTRILLLYTGRYDDFSVPGGGVTEGEELEAALVREMVEETGARRVRILAPLGRIDESRPHRGSFDAMHMQSFVYRCEVEGELGETAMESYEIANAMRPEWVELADAIAHNRKVLERAHHSMGTSVFRETRLLEWIAGNLC
ncbi:MAG: NUDIX domain-containing protein [Pseudoxanthomonas sp.]|nr:NUDIX domain-containing protein [Pseudoxanthomonas sp.]